MIFTISNGRIPKDKPKWTVQMYCYHYLNNCHHFSRPYGFVFFFLQKKIYQHHWAGLSIQMMTSWNCVVSLIIWFQWMIWRSWFLTVWQEFVIPKSEMISALFLCCFVTISIQDELSPWWEFLGAAKWCQSFGRR